MTEPDRTIDAQIQALLFPWDETCCRSCGWRLAETVEQGCILNNCSRRPLPTLRADRPAFFSTDLNAAMRAYQEFREKSPDDPPLLTLTKTIFRDPNKQWFAELEWIEGPSIEELAATPAMAICLALLAALSKPTTEPARSDKAKEVTK